MKLHQCLAALVLIVSFSFAAFDVQPYLYAAESNATVNFTTFQTSNNSTAQIVRINGEEALLLVDGKLVTDKVRMADIITVYYKQNFYISPSDLADLKGYADAFNASRNAMTRYGPAEKICYEGGTFLSYKPCNTLATCMQTASLVCTISGADGCIVDLLATHILYYSQTITKLNAAYDKFIVAYNSLSAGTITSSLDQMNTAFDEMKSAADAMKQSKLLFPETFICRDCLGRCPEPKFDYAAITAGKAKVASLKVKTAPFASLESTIARISVSTGERVSYRQGEEQAEIYEPRFNAARAKFTGLKAQAVTAKTLVSDSDFVSAADAFISSSDELELKVERRDFTGFDALLLSYGNSGNSLLALVNNSTSAYYRALDGQDDAGDLLLQALWKVDPSSQSSVEGYNALAARKNSLDARFSPPLNRNQYAALSADYAKLSADTESYLRTSTSIAEPVYSAGNGLERTSVSGAMTLASSFVPISFATRQSVARYIPPIVLGVIDLSLIALVLVVFAAVFYQFQGFFKSKLALSGWVLTAAAFVFVLLIGSAGFYGVILSAEKYSTFVDFSSALRGSKDAAIVVRETGATNEAITDMRGCAEQVRAQLALMGKRATLYYINGNSCRSLTPSQSANSTNVTYSERTGLLSDSCLDSMPDVPVFDLRFSQANMAPVFTTVVVEQAIFSGNEAYYGKKPTCDAANVLG